MKIQQENSQVVLALDLGGTKIAGGVVGSDGAVHLAKTVPTQAWEGGEKVMQRIIALAQDLLSAAENEPGLQPAAVGIGTGGLVTLPQGTISYATSAIPDWGGMPVRQRLEEALGLPVGIENDGNAMVLGEATFGAGKNFSLVIGITVGTGIGGGITMDGHIFHGGHGYSNNIGHMVIEMDGRLCPCGRRGCLEAYGSGTAMTAAFSERVGRARLEPDFGLYPGQFGVKEIANLAVQGSPEAVATLEEGAGYLGTGIASLINLIDPDIVVIGGGAAQSGEIYFNRLREVAARQVLPGIAHVPIVPAALKNWANLVGAACIVWGNSDKE